MSSLGTLYYTLTFRPTLVFGRISHLILQIAQFVGNAVGVYTSGHTGARSMHGPACASTLTEPRSGDSKQGQDDTERSD